MDYILLIGLLFCLLLLVILVKRSNSQITGLRPYTNRETLFSPAERSFYLALRQAVGSHGIVFAKVRLADLIKPIKGLDKKQWQKAFNRISSKHLDYVICDPSDLSVKFVVELDDKSHQRKDRINRDLFLDQACLSAGLNLYRFRARRAYAISDITAVLFGGSLQEPSEKYQRELMEDKLPEQAEVLSAGIR